MLWAKDAVFLKWVYIFNLHQNFFNKCIVESADGKLRWYKYVRTGKYRILNIPHYFYYLSLTQFYEALDTNIKTKIRNFSSVDVYCSVYSACSLDSKALTQKNVIVLPSDMSKPGPNCFCGCELWTNVLSKKLYFSFNIYSKLQHIWMHRGCCDFNILTS